MVGPSYKENEGLIFREGEIERERERKKYDKKADSESMETASLTLNNLGQGTG